MLAGVVQAESASPAGSEEVIVTGTRLHRAEYNSIYPAASVDAAQIERRGITNLLDALNTLPITGLGASPRGAQAAQGVASAFANLFDLGSQRTLTLVNGRRFVGGNQSNLFAQNAPGLQVDLNVVPVALVDRVEVVSIGGAPSYGADAIAGTVNVVLKRDFEGTEVQSLYGSYEHGVGETWRLSALHGSAFDEDRGHVQIAFEHDEADGYSQSVGRFLAMAAAVGPNPLNGPPFASALEPNGVFDNILTFDRRFPSVTTGGAIFRSAQIPNYLTAAGRRFLLDHPGADPALALYNGAFDLVIPGVTTLKPAMITRPATAAEIAAGARLAEDAPFLGPRVAVPLLFNPDGTIRGMDVGLVAAEEPLGITNAIGGDGLNLVPLTTLASSVRRTLMAATADYDLTPHTRLYAEGYFADIEGVEPYNQPAFNGNLFGGTSAALGFRTDNPFLTDQARAVLSDPALNLDPATDASLTWQGFGVIGSFGGCRVPGMPAEIAAGCPTPAPGTRVFFTSRDYEDILGTAPSRSETKTWRTVVGAAGEFDAVGRSWSWDASFTYGRSHSFNASPSLGQATFNAARDAVSANGAIVCRVNAGGAEEEAARFAFRYTNVAPAPGASALDASSPAPPTGFYRRAVGDPLGASEATLDACAPLDLFGDGASSEAARDYVRAIYETENTNEQYVAELNLAGELVELPAGPVALAAGVAWRREATDFRSVNDVARYGLARSVAFQDITGKAFETREAYGELVVPLIGGETELPLVHELALTGSWRVIDNSIAGTDDAWTVGLNWSPDDWLTLRAATTKSVRAPSLTELYLPASSVFQPANDPCDASQIAGGASPENRRANCEAAAAALGFTGLATFTSAVRTIPVQGTASGNLDLENEHARSDTIGFVVHTGALLGEMAFSADWLDVRMTQAIENAGLIQLLQACYDAPVYPVRECGLFTREPGNSARPFQIALGSEIAPAFRGGYLNAGYRKFRGAQASFDWRFGVGELGAVTGLWAESGNLGEIGVHLDYAYVDRLLISISGTGSDLNIEDGETGRPTNEHQLAISYTNGPFDMGLVWAHQGEVRFDRQAAPENREQTTLSAYDVFHLSLAYTIDERVRLQAVVNNLFDTQPPFGTGSIAYDQVGRQFELSAKVAM